LQFLLGYVFASDGKNKWNQNTTAFYPATAFALLEWAISTHFMSQYVSDPSPMDYFILIIMLFDLFL
jgi:hypothetical protein